MKVVAGPHQGKGLKPKSRKEMQSSVTEDQSMFESGIDSPPHETHSTRSRDAICPPEDRCRSSFLRSCAPCQPRIAVVFQVIVGCGGIRAASLRLDTNTMGSGHAMVVKGDIVNGDEGNIGGRGTGGNVPDHVHRERRSELAEEKRRWQSHLRMRDGHDTRKSSRCMPELLILSYLHAHRRRFI